MREPLLGHVVLYLVKTERHDGREGVLLAVDGACLQRLEGLLHIHRDRLRFHRLEGRKEHFRSGNAQFQSLDVGGGGDRAFAVGQLPEAIDTDTERLDAVFLVPTRRRVAKRSIDDFNGDLVIVDKEGQAEYIKTAVNEKAGDDG